MKETTRNKFEAWVATYMSDPGKRDPAFPEGYTNIETCIAWDTWQAALAQSPASPLPEAAEPVAWQHLKAYGYAPGNYMNKCRTCGKVVEFVDKRAITCRPCAEARHAAAPSPVAQAPAQAGAVVRELVSEQAEDDGLWFTATSASEAYLQQELRRLHAAIEALATQPLAAPVQQEAEAWQYQWNDNPGVWFMVAQCDNLEWLKTNRMLTVRPLYATPPSQPVLAPVVREPLSDDDVQWVVNDNAELGVKIGEQFFFLYKGYSLVYERGLHDDDTPMHWRPVFKREFGECCHPINYKNPEYIGTVSLDDSDEWKPLPAAHGIQATTGEPS